MTKEEKGKFAFDRFIAGAKSDTARDYWYSKFKQELGQKVGQVVQVERMYSEEDIENSIKPKQQTLEEVVENIFGLVDPILGKSDYRLGYERGLIDGAKWMEERMYTEKEVLKLLITFSDDRTFLKKDVAIQWFEQFKKQ
jgi:hypothetical protein